MIKKYLALFLLLSCAGFVRAQQGLHGAATFGAGTFFINEYTNVVGSASGTTINVGNSALNANGRFPANLAPGDLIMIYQVQGVWIRNQFDVIQSDTSWGKIQSTADYFVCGAYEFRQVLSVPSATQIIVDCGLNNTYTTGSNGQVAQVIRVPRYTSLTLNGGATVTCDDWNGVTGGVLVAEVTGNTVINAGAVMDATGRGFRGGALDNQTSYGSNTAFSTNNTLGAEKGEGVVGYQTSYSIFGGQFCRAPATNGGGGGDGHNGGGGGGANGPNSTSASAIWWGLGIPDPNPAYTSAWNLEPPIGTMQLRTAANSAGGGRGGYTFSSANLNAGSVGPSNASWGGDQRRHDGAGLGGRPLDYSFGRLFLGGGGGAGDANQSGGGAGGDGGGLIYILCYGNVLGSGTITSNGTAGGNAIGGTGPVTGIDGAGGGGAGGTIVLNAVGGVANTLTLNANGGVGGSQTVAPTFATNEAEGPGGGGGGGYIAVSAGAPTRNVNGGNNGVTNSPGVTEFPPNGATRGCPGTNNASITNFDITVSNQTICAGQSATITPTVTGTPPPGYVLNWYTVPVGGASIFTGNSYNTGVLAVGTYTYYVGACPGWWREAVTITVGPAPGAPVMSSNSPVCSGNALNLFSNTVAGATYSWTGPNSFSSALEDPTIGSATVAASGTYSLTISVGTCVSPQGTINVTVNPTPAAPTVGSNSPICAGQTLNLTSNTVAGATYTWTGPNSFSSSLEDPTIPSATTAATGTYSLTVTVGGCVSSVSTVAVTVSNTPAAPTISSNTPVCSGNALNLFANTVAGGTYNWTGPNSFSSALEDPTIASATTAATGTYSLTISVGGCTSPQSTTSVVVNPTPAAPTVGSNSPICAGQTLNLTANTVAGATYTWTGPNSFSSSLEDPTIPSATTAATGTYSLTITVGGCVSSMSTVNVTVSNTPAAPTLSSNTPVCSGNTLNLFANTVAGGTYNWTGPNSFSSALEDPTIGSVTTAATGTYSLTISVGGCTSPQSTTNVVVNPTPAAPTVGSNSPICAGQTLNLTSNTYAGGTYAWTGPNSFSSALEDPTIPSATTAATGTYSLTVTVGGCVSAQSTVSVIVGTTPGAPTISSNTPVCTGNTLNLFANTVAGGTYSWTGPNSFSSSLEDPTISGVTALAAGTYSLTISVGSCSSPQSTTTVVVNPTPAAPTAGSNSPICSGQTLNLTSNTVAGATYLWTGPNSFSSSLEDPSIVSATTAANGTYSLTVTVGGCTSAQSTVAVVVGNTPAAPVLSSNTPVCSGNTVNLFANTVAGGTYNWTGPNSFSSSLEDPTIPSATTTATGTYSLTISVGGCTSPQSTVSVTVNPIPAGPGASSNTPICEGQTLNLTSSTVAAATYNWTGPNSFSSTLEDPSITSATPAATGMYYVSVTVNGCTSPLDSTAVTINALPAVSAGADVSVCQGDSVALSGTGTGTMAWTTTAGLSCTTCPAPNASPASTTTYTLTLTDANGCVNTDSVLVTVNTLPTAVAGADVAYCAGDSTTLNGSGGGTYSWLPVTDLSNASIANPVANPTVTTTYVLEVTDGNGCRDTDAVVVTVNTLPVVSAGADQSMCPTGSVPLNASGATNYTWSPAAGLSCTNCQSPNATPASTTTYVVVGTDANGCVNNDTVVVTVAPNLVITASNDQTICMGDSAALTTNGSGTFVWSPAVSLSDSSAQNPNAGPSVTTTYTITVTDLSGCTGSDSVTVFVNQPIVTTLSGATTICIGQSANLSASSTGGDGNYSYTWNPGPLTGSSVTVSPTTTTQYTVDATDSVGCTDQQTITVTVNPALQLSSINPVSACIGGTANLSASATGGDNNYTYTWFPGGLNGANQTVTVSTTQTYTVVVTDGCGSPADSATVTVTANQPPSVSVAANSTVGCSPFCVSFTGISSASCVSSFWDFGNGNTAISDSTNCYMNPGVYDVTYTCTDSNGCVGTSVNTGLITVSPNPGASFTIDPASPITLTNGSATVNMLDFSSGATTWGWTVTGPGSPQSSNQQNPSFTFTDTGSYSVQLIVRNAAGCADTLIVPFTIENPCGEIFVPSAFSPNGDGQNDTLFVYGNCITFMQFEVYSRWGEQVFLTTNPANGWDGTWRGKECESGVFTYVLTGQLDNGDPIEKQGHITLVR